MAKYGGGSGSITIVKDADPTDGTAFDFTETITPGTFTLMDPSDDTEVFAGIAAALEAARLARAAGRPVRVAYSRAEEMTLATFRPAAIVEVRSGFTREGRIVAWEFIAHPRRLAGPSSVSVTASESPLRPGSYRSLGGAVNHFAREVHMDEIAHATGIDPVELRLRNLDAPRFRRVLEGAADEFGWTAASPRDGAGVALGSDVGRYVAACAQVATRAQDVRVDRVAVALDCGLTVNPEGARNQVEGSVVMGLGTALYEEVDFEAGHVLNASFARYRVPRITDSPEIDVRLVGVASDDSTGAGEPAIVVVAPAIANAVFASTGDRIRELPIARHLGANGGG